MAGNLPDGTTDADVDRAAPGYDDEPIPACEHGAPGDEYCIDCDREDDERAQFVVDNEPTVEEIAHWCADYATGEDSTAIAFYDGRGKFYASAADLKSDAAMRAAGDATFDALVSLSYAPVDSQTAAVVGGLELSRTFTGRLIDGVALLHLIKDQMRADLAAWDEANRLYQRAILPDSTGEDLARYCRAASRLPDYLCSPALVAGGAVHQRVRTSAPAAEGK